MDSTASTPNKRERLVEAAATLFHRKGVVATSLADIAKEADIPIGNVYYYFKTKEELALAAILKHKARYESFYEMLNENVETPRQRLVEAVSLYDKVKTEFTTYGCPIGKIVMDSGGDNEAIVKAAASVFESFIQWAESQFILLGHNDEARAHATMLMANIQGAVLMAKALDNEAILAAEILRISNFIENLPNKRIQLGKIGFKAVPA